MIDLQIVSPLRWPAHLLRTERFARSNPAAFQSNLTVNEAIDFLRDELAQCAELDGCMLSTDFVHLGTQNQTHSLSKDTGACLHMKYEGNIYTLASDRWQTVMQNIYALHLGVRFYRQMADWGLGSMSQLMTGIGDKLSLHAQQMMEDQTAPKGTSWRDHLGLGMSATLDDANAVYRSRAKLAGEGNAEAMQVLNAAISQARKYLS